MEVRGHNDYRRLLLSSTSGSAAVRLEVTARLSLTVARETYKNNLVRCITDVHT